MKTLATPTKQQGTGNGNYRQLTLIPSPRHLIRGLVGSGFMKRKFGEEGYFREPMKELVNNFISSWAAKKLDNATKKVYN